MEDIYLKFLLNIVGFSSFGSFMKILTVSSSLAQSCLGTDIEDLCKRDPATLSSLEKHQELHSGQWARFPISPSAPDLECGLSGCSCPRVLLPWQPCHALKPAPLLPQNGLQSGEVYLLETKTLASKTKAQHAVVTLAHGDKY